MKRVGVVGSALDDNTRYVADAVARSGAEPVLIETARVPERARLSWDDGATFFEGRRIDDLKVFYVKMIHLSLGASDPLEMPNRAFAAWQEAYTAERERHSFIAAVMRNLAMGALFVNPVETFDIHFLKLHQAALLAKAGIPVPPSLGTSDPASVRPFIEKHGSVIVKPLAGGAIVRRVTADDLTPEHLAKLHNCPALFQKEIPGQEYRVYLLDGEPVAAFELPTTELAEDSAIVDARMGVSRVKPAELPPEAWDMLGKAARTLGLVFTAADVRRTVDGQFVVLELNPTPAISYFEDPREGRVIRRLADFLVSRA